jgi:putative peptidoglycan lipid II flippase
VFLVQCVVGATNVLAALGLVALADAEQTSPALVLAYGASYVVGAALSYAVLRRVLGGLETPRLVRFLARLAVAALVSTGVALGVAVLLRGLGDDPHLAVAALRAAAVTVVDVGVFLAMARVLRLDEVTAVLGTVTARLPGRRGG